MTAWAARRHCDRPPASDLTMALHHALAVLTLICLHVIAADEKQVMTQKLSSIEHHPYMVQLMARNRTICVATVISRHCALTSALCVNGLRPQSIQVRGGSSSPSMKNSFVVDVRDVIIHPKFRHEKSWAINDIALVRVWQSFYRLPGTPIKPILVGNIPMDQFLYRDSMMIVHWHLSRPQRMAVIVEMHLNKRSSVQCTPHVVLEQNSMFCAVTRRDLKKLSWGDFGCPAVVRGRMMGVVSYYNKSVTMFTSVPHYIPWLYTFVHDAPHEDL